MLLVAIALAIAPGIFFMYFYYKKDKWDPEPKWLIVKTFLFGILICFPVIICELPFPGAFLGAVIAAPIFEELFKYFAVRWAAYKNPAFNEPMDGLVYSSAAALGFATIENIMYVGGTYLREGVAAMTGVVIIRALLSVPGHALFSGMWGYALGKAKFSPAEQAKGMIIKGLLLAMVSHALFNLMLTINPILIIVVVGLVIVLWVIMFKRIKEMLKLSPFNPDNAQAQVSDSGDGQVVTNLQCSRCGTTNTNGALYCRHCGNKLEVAVNVNPKHDEVPAYLKPLNINFYTISFAGCLLLGVIFMAIGVRQSNTPEAIQKQQTSVQQNDDKTAKQIGDNSSDSFKRLINTDTVLSYNGISQHSEKDASKENTAKPVKVDETVSNEDEPLIPQDSRNSDTAQEDKKPKKMDGVSPDSEHVTGSRGGEFILLGLMLLISAVGIHLRFTYKIWNIMSKYSRRATGASAVWMQLIPFYNLYWYFQIYHGLAQDYNQYLVQNNKELPEMSEGIGMTVSILFSAMAVPYLNIIAFIPWLIMYTLFMKDAGDKMNRLAFNIQE